MTSAVDEAAVRRWLVDYLVTNNGRSPEQIDAGASMHDLGVGSRDAVVLTGVLSEFVGRTVSPVDFWQYRVITDSFADGYGQCQATVWDDRGRPVALSRQTVVVFG